jgi:hypothetical protein
MVQALICGPSLHSSLGYKSADESLDTLAQISKWNPVVTQPLFDLLRV